MRPKHIAGIGVAAALILLVAARLQQAQPVPDHPYYADRPALAVIAHQGGNGLWPGNTLAAFQKAVALGVDVLEMDLHASADGVLVVIHDDTVDRTTDGKGAVAQMNLAELQRLDAGYGWSADEGATFPYRGRGLIIPTLAEVFEAFPGVRMNLEIKPARGVLAGPLCELVHRYNMQERVLVVSFHDAALAEFRSVCPGVATAAARLETARLVLLSKVLLGGLLTPAYQSLQVPPASKGIRVLTPRFVTSAQARNLKVEPWTVNDPDQMRQYMAWGVDGIITDRPDLLLQIRPE